MGVVEKILADVLDFFDAFRLSEENIESRGAGCGNDGGHADAVDKARRAVFKKFHKLT